MLCKYVSIFSTNDSNKLHHSARNHLDRALSGCHAQTFAFRLLATAVDLSHPLWSITYTISRALRSQGGRGWHPYHTFVWPQTSVIKLLSIFNKSKMITGGFHDFYHNFLFFLVLYWPNRKCYHNSFVVWTSNHVFTLSPHHCRSLSEK